MNSADYLFYPSLVLFAVNAIILMFLYHIYQKNKKLESQVYGGASKLMQEAHVKSQDIIESAIRKSKQILNQTEFLREDLIRQMEMTLQESAKRDLEVIEEKSSEIDEFYKQMLEAIKQEHLKKAEQTFKSIDTIAQKELSDFQDVLKHETVSSEDLVLKRANEAYEKTQAEIEEYRKQKFAQIDDEVKKLIAQVTMDILGKTFSPLDHEKLITDALIQAKKEGILKSHLS